ncbi:hypothetical protein M8818_002261 [Zalaria obscura]|uniref:Uncharacterized protein n=1 Tax=Zalaria obscura TaxID=2024903 RepID=A0ACC3SIW6_9PEZI
MAGRGFLSKAKDELGITSLLSAPRDVWLLLTTRILRMFAYGSSTLILALYFAALGHSDSQIGLFMTLTLVGDVLISLALTLVADSLGRRRILLLGSLLMTASGTIFAITSNYWILLFAAVVGVISPSGNEIGPFRAVEESTIAHLSADTVRSDIFAWYVVFGTLGTSLGALGCGWVTNAIITGGRTDVEAYRFVFLIYAVIGLVKAMITLMLSPSCEAEPPKPPSTNAEESRGFLAQGQASNTPPSTQQKSKWAVAQLSPASRRTLLKLCALFSVDSLASGMVPTSLVSYYISRKFSISQATLGTIVAAASFMSSIGNIFASSLSKRIGFIHTMVFTHLPSAAFLMLLPAPHGLFLTIVFLVLRATLASMDQAPRSAFLSAVVLPNERTATMGVVNTVKTTSQSAGPLITGLVAGAGHFWIAFVVAGALKASYDLGMLAIFSSTKVGANADQQKDRARYAVGEPDDGGDEAEAFELESDDEGSARSAK